MTQKEINAVIFDMNGTMIDDMAFHVTAWSDILNNDLHAGLSEAEVRKQMYGKNGEVLDRIFGKGHFNQEESDRLSIEKEKRYQLVYKPHLKLIEGLQVYLRYLQSIEIPVAMGTAAIPFNIDFVLDNLHIRNYFSVIVSADDVQHSKPDPETFLKAASLMNIAPEHCVVFEDAPKGVEAAERAGMQAVVLTTMHNRDEFEGYNNVVTFINNYTDPILKDLL
ncbi:MAG: HAD family phosphatase [Bacteroidetes bacterium]|nr:HAD family phosphatase [Bacteroidota bacterium]